jgi:hypothetical protein
MKNQHAYVGEGGSRSGTNYLSHFSLRVFFTYPLNRSEFSSFGFTAIAAV